LITNHALAGDEINRPMLGFVVCIDPASTRQPYNRYVGHLSPIV